MSYKCRFSCANMIEELENGNTEQFSDVMSSWLPPCNGKSLVKMKYNNVDGTCQYGFRPLVEFKGEFEPFEASCRDEPGQLVDGTMRSVYKSTEMCREMGTTQQ